MKTLKPKIIIHTHKVTLLKDLPLKSPYETDTPLWSAWLDIVDVVRAREAGEFTTVYDLIKATDVSENYYDDLLPTLEADGWISVEEFEVKK